MNGRPEWDRVSPAIVQPALDLGLQPFTLRVLTAISHGLDIDGAAEVLGVTPATIHSEIAIARRALAAKNQAHLMRRAFENGLLH